MMFAAGPWIRSKDKPPPKDGRQILAAWADEVYVARWEEIMTLKGRRSAWTIFISSFNLGDTIWQRGDDPIAWAEIRPYQKEGDER